MILHALHGWPCCQEMANEHDDKKTASSDTWDNETMPAAQQGGFRN
jgi:hypothetical protein